MSSLSQTKKGSFVEAWANVVIGFITGYVANLTILPLYGFDVSYSQALGIVVLFTAISVVRSYYVRRLFNSIKHKWNTYHG